jgi:hypothetical protein
MARMNAQSVASILTTTLAVLLAVGLAASTAAPACIAECPCIDWTGRLLIRSRSNYSEVIPIVSSHLSTN